MNLFPRLTVSLSLGLAVALFGGTALLHADYNSERRIQMYNIHNDETIDIVYKKDGQYIPAALEKLNWFMRDWRRNEATKMDPHTIDLVWEIHEELGSKVPIHLISGYRSPATNEALRNAGGGQAQHSQHLLGKALDVTFPDIPVQQLHYAGLEREAGGVGYYPTSGVPFVHIDSGNVRMWPRIGRYELALLFPSGHSKFVPEDGRPITSSDVTYARGHYTQLAEAIAAFHQFRAGAKDKTMVAGLEPDKQPTAGGEVEATPASAPAAAPSAKPAALTVADNDATADDAPALAGPALKQAAAPVVVKPGKPVVAAVDLGAGSAAKHLAKQVVAAIDAPAAGTVSPAFLNKAGWVAQPDYDSDHADEMSYRPFPLAGLIEANPSTDNPVLSHLSRPDLIAAHKAIGDDEGLKMHFRPTLRLAEMIWNDEQAGRDVTPNLYAEAGARASQGRVVKTASAD